MSHITGAATGLRGLGRIETASRDGLEAPQRPGCYGGRGCS